MTSPSCSLYAHALTHAHSHITKTHEIAARFAATHTRQIDQTCKTLAEMLMIMTACRPLRSLSKYFKCVRAAENLSNNHLTENNYEKKRSYAYLNSRAFDWSSFFFLLQSYFALRNRFSFQVCKISENDSKHKFRVDKWRATATVWRKKIFGYNGVWNHYNNSMSEIMRVNYHQLKCDK